MKSRWTTYLLCAAVVAVWGVVAWRILAPTRPSVPSVRTATDGPVIPQIVVETLRMDYPDPFLKSVARSQTAAPRSVVRSLPPAKKARQKPHERIPLVHLASVKAEAHAFHILAIGEEQYELSEGDTADGWRLVKVDRDSLYLEYKGETCCVKRCE